MTSALTLFHTSDWHLGQVYRDFQPEFSATLRKARIEAIGRILDRAQAAGATLVLVAGDQFDGPNSDPDLLTSMFERIAAYPSLAVHMIPGNHDPGQPGSVYTRSSFKRDAPANLNLHLKAEAVPLAGLGATLYPCPALSRWESADPLAWIPPRRDEDGLRIAMAHGSLPSIPSPEGRNAPISADAADRLGLDYVALGDWHSANPSPEDRPDDRLYYSGAPEVGGWDETGAGSALEVRLGSPGDRPRVVRRRVGHYDWVRQRAHLQSAADVAALLLDIDRLASPDRLLKLVLEGSLTAAERQALDLGLEARRGNFAAWVESTEELGLALEGAIQGPRDPLLNAAFYRLSTLLDDAEVRLPATLPEEARGAIDGEVVGRALRTFLGLIPQRS